MEVVAEIHSQSPPPMLEDSQHEPTATPKNATPQPPSITVSDEQPTIPLESAPPTEAEKVNHVTREDIEGSANASKDTGSLVGSIPNNGGSEFTDSATAPSKRVVC